MGVAGAGAGAGAGVQQRSYARRFGTWSELGADVPRVREVPLAYRQGYGAPPEPLQPP